VAPWFAAVGQKAEALRFSYFFLGLALIPIAYFLAGALHPRAALPAAVLMACPTPYLLLLSALPPPLYPDAAKRMRTQGVVSVDVILDETGKVVSANASSGPPILREAAVQAALRARFSPTKLSGQPVKVSGVINYKFALVP